MQSWSLWYDGQRCTLIGRLASGLSRWPSAWWVATIAWWTVKLTTWERRWEVVVSSMWLKSPKQYTGHVQVNSNWWRSREKALYRRSGVVPNVEYRKRNIDDWSLIAAISILLFSSDSLSQNRTLNEKWLFVKTARPLPFLLSSGTGEKEWSTGSAIWPNGEYLSARYKISRLL